MSPPARLHHGRSNVQRRRGSAMARVPIPRIIVATAPGGLVGVVVNPVCQKARLWLRVNESTSWPHLIHGAVAAARGRDLS